MNINRRYRFNKAFMAIVLVALSCFGSFPSAAYANQITSRSLTIDNSKVSTSAGWIFKFHLTLTPIRSIRFQVCTTPLGTCTVAPGFSNASNSPNGSSGIGGGFTGDKSFADSLAIKSATNVTNPNPGTSTVPFINVVNPSSLGTYYVRITTYSDDTYTTLIDSGVVAAALVSSVSVSASVQEALAFCVGATGTDCVSIAGGTVTLAPNPLSQSSASTGTSVMSAATNATSGYSISYFATSFSDATSDTIGTSPVNGQVSVPGTELAALNLMANSTPIIGAAPSGGTGTVSASYNTANNYSFTSGATTAVASAAIPTAPTLYTVSYVVNISGVTKPGSYASTFTYVCTGQF